MKAIIFIIAMTLFYKTKNAISSTGSIPSWVFSVCSLLLALLITVNGFAQNVGVGVPVPLQKLDVGGAVKIGTTATNEAGTVRYNAGKFEGGDGTNWKSFEGTASGIVGTKLYNNPALLNAGYSLFGEIAAVSSYNTSNTTFLANSWQPTYTRGIVANVSAPPNQVNLAVWAGGVMYVPTYNNLYSYNPVTDLWNIVSNQGFAAAGKCIWTGTEIVFWSGSFGSRYNPATDVWTDLPVTNAPSSRSLFSITWDGSRVIIWGGTSGGIALNTGAMYNPSTNLWTSMNTAGAPAGRGNHTAIWNNVTNRMIIWGGSVLGVSTNTGGLFNPVLNTWTGATSPAAAPANRYGHTAVWTGVEMIIFGGLSTTTDILNSGGKYNPSTNSWTTTNTSGAYAVYDHAAVWTGTAMFVAGGARFDVIGGPIFSTNRSFSYNPTTDVWTVTPSFINTEDGKEQHYSFLAGNMIVVWGGINRAAASPVSNTGYRYFLVNTASSATTLTNETLYLYQKN